MTARPPDTAGGGEPDDVVRIANALDALADDLPHYTAGDMVELANILARGRPEDTSCEEWGRRLLPAALRILAEDVARAVSGGRDPDPAVERAALDVVERMESHEEGGCCRLDARDRTAIKRLRAAIGREPHRTGGNVTELWEFLVPTVRSNGKPYHTRYHRLWDAKVRAITGGLTIMGVAKGSWISPDGTLFSERMIPVRIACTKEQAELIGRLTLEHYPDQEAVMGFRISDHCGMWWREEHYGYESCWKGKDGLHCRKPKGHEGDDHAYF
jgi:hypothetical protein